MREVQCSQCSRQKPRDERDEQPCRRCRLADERCAATARGLKVEGCVGAAALTVESASARTSCQEGELGEAADATADYLAKLGGAGVDVVAPGGPQGLGVVVVARRLGGQIVALAFLGQEAPFTAGAAAYTIVRDLATRARVIGDGDPAARVPRSPCPGCLKDPCTKQFRLCRDEQGLRGPIEGDRPPPSSRGGV